jgi:hypothetical protein
MAIKTQKISLNKYNYPHYPSPFTPMKHLFFTLLIFITSSAFAQDPDKTVTLKASGSGTTQEQAKNNALRSAVEQAYGAFISSKTEILNDQVVADEIVSVASGNIQAFKILEEQHTDSLDFCLLEAVVSISKLTSFAQSKGYTVEVQGGLFAMNIKQKQLNESAEIVAVTNALTTALELLKDGFDFDLVTKDPVINDAIKGDWKIGVRIGSKTNENYLEGHKIIQALLENIGMTDNEVSEYKALSKQVYQLNYHYSNNEVRKFNLRTSESLWAFIRMAFKIPILSQRFIINDGLKKYKNGVRMDFENISGTIFNASIDSMINQFTRIESNRGINSDWANIESMNTLYKLRSEKNYLRNIENLNEDNIGWKEQQLKKRIYYYSNDPYYEYYPTFCVSRLDYYEIANKELATSYLNLFYSLDEIERITQFQVEKMRDQDTPISKKFKPAIDIYNCALVNDIVSVNNKNVRPFLFSAQLQLIDDPNRESDISPSKIIGNRYEFNILKDGANINNNFVSHYLEGRYNEIDHKSFRPGIYEITIDYIAENDGTVSILSAKPTFHHNDNPKEFVNIIESRGGIPIEFSDELNYFKHLWNNKIKTLTDQEFKSLSQFIYGSVSKIKNHPIGISKENCLSCPKTKVRIPLSCTYTLYIN